MTLSTPSISVTMAAFNVEAYIEECLDSVLNQSFRDFEFIIVDDASTDRTRKILEIYKARDPRIRLILKDRNEGLAVARNDAIAAAQGKYVAFLDADDLFHPDMLKLAFDAAEAADAEMVLWDYVVFRDEAEIGARQAQASELARISPADKIALLDRPAFAWTRLVRLDVVKRLEINFPKGRTYQDVPVHWRLVTRLDRIFLLPHRLSFYRQRPEATTAGKGLKRADYLIVLDQVEADLQVAGLFDVYADTFTARQLNVFYGVHDVVSAEHSATVMRMIEERLCDRHWAYLAAGKPLRWQARAFFRSMRGNQFAKLSLAARSGARRLYRAVRRAR